MSQSGTFFSGLSPSGPVTTLTGNTGGPVAPTVGNINIVGAGFIDVVGTPGTSTLTISSSGAAADQFDADVGMAIPVAGILNIVGSTNINTLGSGNTIEIFLDDDVVITGSFTAGTTAGFITAVTGDISADAGNFNLPNTLSSGLEGIITFGGNHYIQNFGGNFFLGNAAGNLTLTIGTAINNVVLGDSGLHDVTIGHNNTSIGFDGMLSVTSGSVNTGIGSSVLAGITSGSNNTALGAGSGSALLTNESNNILIGNPGVVADQNILRIGVTGTGTLEQNECFIAGITGNTVSNPLLVTINSSTGQLGVTSSGSGTFANSFTTDSGTATPSGGIIDIAGGSNINTSGATNVVTVNLDNTVSISGSMTAGTGFTATTGDMDIVAGNLDLPNTNSAGTQGVITFGGNRFIHNLGTDNAFIGGNAGNFTFIVGDATDNIALGSNTLQSLLNGQANIAIGTSSLVNVDSGSSNIAIGLNAGATIVFGGANIIIGTNAMPIAAAGSSNNVVIGDSAMGSITGGSGLNVAIGPNALSSLTSGQFNIVIGALSSGSAYTTSESSNILIGSSGVIADNNVIRIGTQGTGTGQQNACFIAGIVGNTVATPQLVTVNTATGQLGVTSASGVTWQVVTGATPLVEGNGYFVNGSSKLQFTLPAAAAVGDTFEIAVLNTAVGGWKINQQASQFIIANGAGFTTATVTTTGTGGNVATTSSGGFLNVTLICAIANTAFVIEYSSLGTNLIFT